MLRSMIVVALLAGSAFAQPKPPRQPRPPSLPPPEHDMGGMTLGAKERRLVFMAFLERASEELERASLNRRSFIPELIKTVDAEQL